MSGPGKTIKQLADEIGVSKQAVTYRLHQLEATKENGVLAVKEDGVLLISLAGETLIKSAFSENDRQTFGDKQPPKDRQTDTELLAVLKATIDALNAQLAVKDRQIDALTETIKAQAQSIHADRQNELAGMLIESKRLIGGEESGTARSPVPISKRGLLSRLFGSRKKEEDHR